MRRELTPRQAQILDLVATGLGDKEIAVRLGLSTNTVRTHLQRYYREHGVRNRAEAAVASIALRHAATPPEPEASLPRPSPAARSGGLRAAIPFAIAVAILITAGYEMGSRSHLAMLSTFTRGSGSGPSAQPPDSGQSVAPTVEAGGAALAAAPAEPTLGTGAEASQTAAPPSPSAATPTSPASPSRAAPSLPAAPPASIPAAPDTSGVSPALGELALVNSDRALAGLPPLSWDPCLASVAALSAERLASLNYIADTGGAQRAAACKGASGRPGENAAYWAAPDDARLNSMFLSQPASKANILGSFKHFGAAWATSSSGVAYLVEEFD